MTQIEVYQEMLVEAIKRRINASVDEQNALDNIMCLKAKYVWEHIQNKQYTLEGIAYKPVHIKWCKSDFNQARPYYFSIIFVAVPGELLRTLPLTKAEIAHIKKYDTEFYGRFSFHEFNNKANISLLYTLQNDLYYAVCNCKNDIQLIHCAEWSFSLDSLTHTGFEYNKLIMRGEDLF